MDPVLTVTVNPALDVATSVDRLVAQDKLRCAAPRFDPGGGGISVSRAIRELGERSSAFVALGGGTGRRYRALLQDAGIDHHVYEAAGETRFSFMVRERASNAHYRFVLPGPEQPAEQAEGLIGAVVDRVEAGGASLVVASGSLPPGLPEDLYGRLIARLRGAGVRLILDTAGPALQRAVSERPYLIKPNLKEATELLGEDATRSPAELAQRLLDTGAAEVVVISLGAEGAVIAAPGARLRIPSPEVEIKSTVGAGDSFIGALAIGLASGWSIEDACRYGVAAGASAVGTEATALCERGSTERYFEQLAGRVERSG